MVEMRTWIPLPNFACTAMVLADQDLLESLEGARQIQSALQGKLVGYSQHPNVLAWQDHILCLMMYSDCLVRESVRRQLQTPYRTLIARSTDDFPWEPPGYTIPEWLGPFRMHSKHRKHLMSLKRDGWYNQWGWGDR